MLCVVEGTGTTSDCACETRLGGGAGFARWGAGIVEGSLEGCLEVAESNVDGGELGVWEVEVDAAEGGAGSGRECIEGEQGEEGEGMVGAGCTERNGIT